ncbi:MAG: cytochrome b/b6 domain-containing protein [Candidatus Hydrogenedentes bacterium]|nr:cytochrome b/b6 domain-containing protein [Candidatus Hydrogenedentota bacterium]
MKRVAFSSLLLLGLMLPGLGARAQEEAEAPAAEAPDTASPEGAAATVPIGPADAVDLSDEGCFVCHGDPEFATITPTGKVVSLYVDQEMYNETIHAILGCVSCHSDITEMPHAETLKPANCVICHEDAAVYANSVHGKALALGDGDVSGCADCHGVHDIRPSEDVLSHTHALNMPATCGKCHSDPALVERHMISIGSPSDAYMKSVHAKVNQDGTGHAAVCSDCHGSHEILPAFDPASPAYGRNIAQTCGTCHAEALAEYETSIHGIAFAKGIPDAPTCTDCHGEHDIEGPGAGASSVGREAVSRETCSRCHDDEKVMVKYGIEVLRQASYMDSYHGMASDAGSEVVANCVSCHGVHNILPEADPRSSVNHANLPQTCAQCHEDAGPNFAVGKVHIMPTDPGQKALGIVRIAYLWLIAVVLGGMFLHNGLLMLRHMREKYKKLRRGQAIYKRFNRGLVIGHFILAVSFIVLAISGFALRYPDAWWSKLIFGGPGFEIRSSVHRYAGAVLIALTVVNCLYVIFTRGGRKELGSLMFRWKDVKDGFQGLAYGLRVTNQQPRFDRYGYAEKLEYWGLWWGTVLMAVTGLAMWYASDFLHYFPKIVLDILAIIHFYEAWLAVGTILIWHMYFIVLSPGAYPMNMSWITGTITEDDLKRHHPLEYERVMGKAGRHADPDAADGKPDQSSSAKDKE